MDLPFIPTDITADDDSLWIRGLEGGLVRLDLRTRETSDPVHVDELEGRSRYGAGLPAWASAHGSLWWSAASQTIHRMDPSTLAVDTIACELPGAENDARRYLRPSEEGVWAGGMERDVLRLLAPDGSTVRDIDVPRSSDPVTVGQRALAAYDRTEREVFLLEAGSGREIGRLRVPGFFVKIAFSGGSFWVLTDGRSMERGIRRPTRPSPELLEVDPGTGIVGRRQHLADPVWDVFSGGDAIYELIYNVPLDDGPQHRLLRIPTDPRLPPVEMSTGLFTIEQGVRSAGSMWFLGTSIKDGIDRRKVVEIDEASSKVESELDLSAMLVASGLPPVLTHEEYERRFVDFVRSSVPLGPGRWLEDVRTRGPVRRREVVVLFRDTRLPECLIGFAQTLWTWAELESGGRDPEADAQMYLFNTWMEFPPIPSPDICHPDADGITWVKQPP